MAIVIVKKKRNGHTKAKPPTTTLDSPGRQMTGNMMAILNVGHTTFCAGVKNGRYPAEDGYDGGRPYWLNETVRTYLSESHGKKRQSPTRARKHSSVAPEKAIATLLGLIQSQTPATKLNSGDGKQLAASCEQT
jgi:hypothetical protein